MIRLIFLTLLLMPLAGHAADGALGEDSRWFVQVNLAAIRGASDDGALYGWLEREVFDDIEEEFGQGSIDEFEAVTVFGTSDSGDGLGIVLDGRMDAETRERLVRRAAATPLEEIGGGDAYVVGGNEELAEDLDIEFDGDPLFLAFGGQTAAFVTTSRSLLEAFLEGARFERVAASELLIIRADPMLAGAFDAEAIGQGHGPWDSKFMRNIRRAGFALSDADGSYDVNVELVAVDEVEAQALQNVVQGVIGLQALADDGPGPEFLSTLQTQREGDRVSLSVRVGSKELMDLID